VKSDSLVEQVAQIEDFGSGRVDGRAFFQRNYFTQGLDLLVRRGFERLACKSEDGAFYLTQAMGGDQQNTGEVFEIVRKRLFDKLPPADRIDEVAQAYVGALQKAKRVDTIPSTPETFIERHTHELPYTA
jgi:hypothetical protein